MMDHRAALAQIEVRWAPATAPTTATTRFQELQWQRRRDVARPLAAPDREANFADGNRRHCKPIFRLNTDQRQEPISSRLLQSYNFTSAQVSRK